MLEVNTEFFIILLSGLCTIIIFSFLWRENPAYRAFEHIFIGFAGAFAVIETLRNFLWPSIFVPLLGLDIIQFPDGTFSNDYNKLNLLYLVPIFFGLLYYTVYIPKFSWLSKIVIAFMLGYAGGLQIEGFFNRVVPQILQSFKPLIVLDKNKEMQWWLSFENVFFVFTLLVVMNYFFFSFNRESKSAQKFNKCGRLLLMLCFGAFFGSTVMARMALLSERVDFLIGKWFVTIMGIFAKWFVTIIGIFGF